MNGISSNSYGIGINTNYAVIIQNTIAEPDQVQQNKRINELEDLNSQLTTVVTSLRVKNASQHDFENVKNLIAGINQKIGFADINNVVVSDSYYLIGIYYLLTDNSLISILYLQKSISFREKLNVTDMRMGRAEYNLGIAFKKVGDYFKAEECNLKAIEIYSGLFGNESPELIDAYTSLGSAYIELQQNEMALSYLNIAMSIAERKPDSVPKESIANIYSNIGVSYSRLADFSRSKIYLDKSLALYNSIKTGNSFNLANLMNSLATTYNSLGLSEKSLEYYEKGVEVALSVPENSPYTCNLVNSYAITLGNAGKIKRGEDLLTMVLKKAEDDSIKEPQLYYEVLYNYAEYQREYNHDIKKSLALFSKCMNYLKDNPNNHNLKPRIYTGYAQTLTVAGESKKALEAIQTFIVTNYKMEDEYGDLTNPDLNSIKPDKATLKLFRTKYQILINIYEEEKNMKFIEAAAKTSELIVAILEQMRINISEEDSRLILGDRYRDAYFAAIHDFNLLYNITSDKKYLDKAFEFSEKSKVAGLLTSTRELKAIQFRIPSDIADYEFRLKNDIGLLNARITEETFRNNPNSSMMNVLSEDLLKKVRLRDSLIVIFEKKYPEYYAVKYNTSVASMNDISKIFGRNVNYVNYLLSDTILYTFIVNRNNKKLIETRVSDSFFETIKKFRSLLSIPAPSDDALSEYKQYKAYGLELERILIEPILPFLISDKLVISLDNILSYIPFETLPSQDYPDSKLYYRSIPYLMDTYDISYTYSATFMAESVRGGYGFRNKVVAFAPDYPDQIDIQSLLLSRQEQSGVLHDLPYAREEARFVADLTGGKLYENSDARESVYKKESGKYDIIHLAMHTLLNDKDPMHSTLIFSPESNDSEDRYLKTYEIYGLPTKAKMVVLSSCNTGTGFLYSGEGILSLARGFIYSGSQSVVMAMWEIEDRSGTKIVKLFYANLKKGYTKSEALRKARIKYLKDSDQLRSHPYFWSTLIIYGDNSPLYYSRYFIIIVAILFIVILVTIRFYLRKRRYS